LREHAELEVRRNICQEKKRAGAISRRQVGRKIGEDVEVGGKRAPVVQVALVNARPPEGLARGRLQALLVNVEFPESRAETRREITADNPHHARAREKRGRRAGVTDRAPQDAAALSRGCCNGIQPDGTHHYQPDRIASAP